MSCVNTKSKEFIETAKRLDLSSGTLELIVHEFQNTEGNEEDFPSDTYIVEKLQGESMTNASEDQVKLWESKYSNPVTASTSKEAEQIATEASRCFPKQSIKIYGTNNGKYKVTVARPFTEAYVKEVQTILRNATRDSQGRLLAPNGEPSNLTEQQYAQVRTKAFINWFGDWINDPENASKVIDENGEPLVVYHGTSNKFSVFNSNHEQRTNLSSVLKNKFYFSGQKLIAEQYASSEEQNDAFKLMELTEGGFSFMEKAEALGFDINSEEELDKAAEYMTHLENDVLETYLMSVFLNIKNPVKADLNGNIISRLTKEQVKNINESEGAILTNVDETVSRYRGEITTLGLYVGTTYIVSSPNQIKSATDNIGTFSTEDNNIYLHTSNIARVRDLLNEFKDKIISFTKTKDIEAYIFKKNKELSSLIPGFNLSAYIQREKGKARFRDSKSSTALEELINLENPMSKDEMEQLFTLLSGKFNMTFEIAETTQGKIVTESGNTQTRCFITKEDGKFKVYINKDKLPSYTILAEEMLHPLVDVIQHDNLTLFNKFLAEIEGIIKSKKDPVLNGIISNIGNSYAGKSSDIINNEKVTQTLAYFLKNSTKEEKSSTFKKIIEAIVKILQKFGILSNKLVTPNFNLKTFAYVLKFENITLDISRAFSTTNTYYHKDLENSPSTSAEKSSINPKTAEFYSGAAKGSDTFWAEEAEKLGITTKHYTPKDWDSLPWDWKARLSNEYEEVVNLLGRKPLDMTSYSGKLVRRDMMQADKADAIFAIGTIASNGYVDGGTGYATTRGIIRGIPVYLFDQADSKWKVWDNESKSFVETSMPRLTPNAATIGTRELKDNGRQAIKDILQASLSTNKVVETYNEILEVLGGGTEAESEVKDVVKTVKKGITFEEALKGVQTIFNEEEIAQIKEAVAKTPKKRLHVMSVSRQTDPAFFSKQIIDFLKENSKKPLTDPTRVNVIEIWSKHDGLPIQDILEACKTYKVAPMVSFSITGLGDTALEKGVLKYTDLLPLIGKLISEGYLNPTTTTVRIDPILVGETNMEDIVKIVTEAKKLGIKKFVTSLVQSYGYLVGTTRDRKVIEGVDNALAEEGRKYDWDKYYGRNHIGIIEFKPKQEYIDEIAKVLLELNKDSEIEIETCAFSIPGLKAAACLDPLIIERLTGIDVTRPDGTYDKDTSRPECMCYGAHSDMFRFKEKTCASSCAYCYAAHSEDKSFRYYDDNGNLIPSRFTEVTSKTSEPKTPIEQPSTDFSVFESENKPSTETQDEETTALVNEIDAVNESVVMTSTEVTKVAQKISYWISDKITEFAKNPELIFVKFPDKRTLDESGQWTEENKTKDIEKVKSMRRLALIRFITPGNLLELCKMEFDKSTTLRTKKKVRFIKNNWNAIISLGSKTLAELEKVTFANDNAEEVLTMEDPDFNSEDTTEGVQETQGNLQEQWQIETKTKDVISTMSQLVRLELRQCFELEEDGFNEDGSTKYKRVKDEFGMDERVEERTVVQSLLSWFRGVENIKDMISTLEGKVDKNPWVSQLLTKLKDTSGDNSDFQSQFFSTFYTAFQTYSVVSIDEDSGKYYTQIVNENPALKEVINSIKVLQKLGTLPIFNTTSVNSERLQELKDEYDSLSEILKKIKNRKLESLSAEDLKDATESIGYAAYLFGYTISPDMVKDLISYNSFSTIVNSLEQIIKHLEDSKNSKIFEPLVYKNEHSIIGNLKSFLKPLVAHLEDVTVESVHNDGKMYQSYVIPSYTSRLMDRFHLKGDRFKEFINNEYDTPWFKETGTDFTRGWRNSWLRTLVNNPESREVLKHKIALNFNKKNYMRDMTESEYLLSILTEYFSSAPKNGRALSWFRIPMQSNKPANEFIRFYSERGTNYKEIITDGFYDILLQELSRIQTVLMRDLNPSDPTYIKNFDKNGKKFCFLSYFSSELTSDSELGKLIQASINGEQLSPEEIIKLEKLAKDKIKQEMDAKAKDILDRWEASGIMEAAKSVQGVNNSYVREDLENFIWNDTFAAMNILQLTITDIAYYKDAEDLQKRLAQLHAPGIRGNVFATDYNGELVSADQKERVIYLKDFDSFKSNIIENIRVVFDRKIEQAPESEKAGLIALRDSLIKEPVLDENGKEIERGGAYWYINIADAQAYNSITSYRKKAFIFGKWSRSAEDLYERIKSNDYTYTELQAAFQPLKPFTYSQVQVNSGVDSAPLSTLKMGVQHKDSEYLLIMAGAILQVEDTGKPNLLRVINEIMEESADSNKGRGIDTVIFESGVKAGLTGVIDLSPYIDMPNGDKEAKAYLERLLYNDTLYNPDYVQEIPFSDYSLQQEVPSHFAGHEQAHGSQIRYITPSDLVATDSFGDTVFYEVRGRKLTAEEFRKEYEETIAANIKESIELLIKEFNLDSLDPKEKRKAISRLLISEIRSNPRYGIDMLYACSIDPTTGDFRIPLGDPIQAKRVEQLLNSIVKNRINKQEISGGPVVQVSNFGTSNELNIRFKDRSGKLLLTRKEFEQNNITGYKTYEEYIKNEQAGIAYFEVYAPAYSKEIFTDFMDPDGTVDIKAIEELNPELLKMIGYRIPTEDKYSTLPLKIVGFLPKEAGEGIMMPNDITLITGSDFDIDKMYLMIKKLDIDPKSRKDISKSLWDKFSSKYKTFSEKNALRERINMFLDNPQIMKSADPEMWKAYKRVAYTVTEPKEGTRYDRDNKIIDMTYTVLTHETVADKILNPGNFEEQKKMGYIAVAKKITKYSYEELYAMDVETLKKICTVDKNLNFIDTHIQFYKQNSAAGSLIGTFAVHKVAHAILESDSFYIDALGATNSINPFTIAGFEFTVNMKIDPTKDSKGNLVGKTLGCLVASSVDAVKDPVLNLMNINSNTSSVLTTLIRLGMPFEEAALFMSQSCITDLISSFEMSKLADPNTSLKKTILEFLKEIRSSGSFSTELDTEELTKEELIEGLTGYSDELEYKVLNNLYKILSIADQLKTITYVTRLNSISNAVGPLIIDNLIMEYKLTQSSEFITKDGELVTTIDVLEEHPILREFYRALDIAKDLLSDMPTNSTRFRSLISFNSKIERMMFSDRKLLNQLSDFYQSFCYVESGVINNDHLPNYIDAFPLYFISKNFKEQYKDNALIQAIKYTEEDGRLVLKVDISGLTSTEKELLSSAWADLHKVNPQLSIQLFNYNFFRSGVGFSPKTFNNLLPSYVKERIKGYTGAFKSARLRDERFIMDLFIRHNWDNNKLVPWRSYKKIVDHIEGNILTIKEELAGLPGVDYFKMYLNKKVQMFRRTGENTFEIVEPLGNNGEYIEISLDKDYKAREVPKTALSKLRADEVVAKEEEEESTGDMITDIEMQARAELILEIFSTNDTEKSTTARIKEFRSRTGAEQAEAESKIKEFISKRLGTLNIAQSAEYVEQLYNDLLTNENLCK